MSQNMQPENRNFTPMKIGVFFGGTSPNRELSYAAGRIVYDSLDKALFTPVPVFIDSLGNFVLLNWANIYQTDIRSFYPPTVAIPESKNNFRVYIESLGNLSLEQQTEIINQVGQPITPIDFKKYFAMALLVLPEGSAEELNLRGLLAWYQIPFAGPDNVGTALSTDLFLQRQIFTRFGWPVIPGKIISADRWATENQRRSIYAEVQQELGGAVSLKSLSGAVAGESVIKPEDDFTIFEKAVEKSFGRYRLLKTEWQRLTEPEQLSLIDQLSDSKTGLGMPLRADNNTLIHHPEQLLAVVQGLFTQTTREELLLHALTSQPAILAEGLVPGTPFTCLVLQNPDGQPVALNPVLTNSKETHHYLPVSPDSLTKPELTAGQIKQIREHCLEVANALNFKVLVQLTGVVTAGGQLSLTDCSTSLAHLPIEELFAQVAQIGLNPTQFLTYYLATSLTERQQTRAFKINLAEKATALTQANKTRLATRQQKIKIAMLIGEGGEAEEALITSGQYIFNQLAASGKYQPLFVLATNSETQIKLFILPPYFLATTGQSALQSAIVSQKNGQEWRSGLAETLDAAEYITATYAGPVLRQPQAVNFEQLSNLVDGIFTVVPASWFTTGTLHTELEKVHLPYTGLGHAAWQTMTDTNNIAQSLRTHNIHFEPATANIFSAGLLTRYLPDGRLGYEVFINLDQLTKANEQQPENLGSGSRLFTADADNSETALLLPENIKADLIKAAQILNLEGYAVLDFSVSQEAAIIIRRVNVYPALNPGATLFKQALAFGYKPYDVLDRIVQFSLERHKKQAGQFFM